jgi:hypothetical protein
MNPEWDLEISSKYHNMIIAKKGNNVSNKKGN